MKFQVGMIFSLRAKAGQFEDNRVTVKDSEITAIIGKERMQRRFRALQITRLAKLSSSLPMVKTASFIWKNLKTAGIDHRTDTGTGLFM